MVAVCSTNVLHHDTGPKIQLQRQQKKSKKMPKDDQLFLKLSLACHIELLQSLACLQLYNLFVQHRVPMLQTTHHSFSMVTHVTIFPLEESTRATGLFKLQAIKINEDQFISFEKYSTKSRNPSTLHQYYMLFSTVSAQHWTIHEEKKNRNRRELS